MPDQTYDLVLYGATSFVGRITARHLFERHHVEEGLRWAIAGRSVDRLAEVRDDLGPEARELPVIVADATDADALAAMVASTRVVISTVGPYARYGSELVGLCAATGTDYADLTGEVQWIRRMIDEHRGAARSSGARIVHSCGFDSIPSDLGVAHLQQVAMERHGAPATRVKMRVAAARGTFSGGTIASLANVVDELKDDPALARLLGDPYALRPEGDRDGPRQPEVTVPRTDPDFDGAVLAPFVMSTINTRVVHRSNALLDDAWGRDLRYDEAMLTGTGPVGWALASGIVAGIGALAGGMAMPPTRWVLDHVLPDPGEGPSPEAQRRGHFTFRFHGTTDASDVVRTRVTGDRDPGYGATARMFGEAGACLATDVPTRDPEPAGDFWTPASLLGTDLVERLRAHAGMTFEVQ